MARIKIKESRGIESVIIDGYVNVTGRDSRPIPDGKGGFFVEKIQQGTFERALKKAREVKILLNHSWDRVLGSTNSNLRLSEDVIGLRAHAEITDLDVVKKAKEGKLRGWSFRFFNPTEQRADMPNGMQQRIITDMEMDEVSLIDETMRPWYPSTTVEARAETDIVYEIRSEEFEIEKEENPDHSQLKKLIEKYGGKV